MIYYLENILRMYTKSFCLYKDQLKPGDYLFLKTINSVYSIKVEEDGKYIVSGGWFDRKKLSPISMNISGCTWGGSVIKTDIVAGFGLSIEFENRVSTSAVQKIFFIPNHYKN